MYQNTISLYTLLRKVIALNIRVGRRFSQFTSSRRTDAVTWLPGAEPHRHVSEILCDCGRQEIILCAGNASQSQARKFRDPLHVTEQRLDFLAITT
jgi:D-hexose-6-phosphate mutarotase